MSSVSFVKANVSRHNTQNYSTPVVRQIPCEGSQVGPIEYFNPVFKNGTLAGYAPTQDVNKLRPDGYTAVRVINGPDRWDVVLAPGSTVATFTDQCNACCGATPDLTANATFPAVSEEQTVDAAKPELYFGIPTNPFTRNYLVPAITYNGGTVPFSPSGAGYSSVANLVTALNTGAGSSMGTFSAIGTSTIKLVPAVAVKSAGVRLSLLDASYCLTIPTSPVQARYLIVKNAANADVQIDLGALTLDDDNRTGVLAAVKAATGGNGDGRGTWSLVNASGWKLQYVGPQKPVAIKSQDLTTVNVTFANGTC